VGLDAQEMEDQAWRRITQYMRPPRRLIFLILLLILSAGYFSSKGFFKKRDVNSGRKRISAPQAPLTEQVRSFSLSGFSETGKKTWEVEGKSADIMSDVINLSDIDADSYGEEVTVNLKSDEGVFDRKTNNIRLKKNVVIITDEGTTLTTDTLDWDASQELISTKDYVFIERKDMDIEGTGASAKPNLKIAQLDDDVRVDVKDPPAIITCDGPLEIDYDKNIAYFYNNVKLVDDKDTTINTDKATGYFDPKSHTLSKVFCQGNVKIVRGKDVTYADELTYLPDEGRVILTGRPKIIISGGKELIEGSKKKKK